MALYNCGITKGLAYNNYINDYRYLRVQSQKIFSLLCKKSDKLRALNQRDYKVVHACVHVEQYVCTGLQLTE